MTTLLLLAVAALIWHTTTSEVETEDRSAERFVFVTTIDADARPLHGPLRSPASLTEAELTALCWAVDAFRGNYLVDADVEILDDPGLRRSAELLSGLYSSYDVAYEAERIGAEQWNWDVEAVTSRLRGNDRWSQSEIEKAVEYLERRRHPTASSAEHFVALRANATLTKVDIVRLAIGRRDFVTDARLQTPVQAHIRTSEGQVVGLDRASLTSACS